LKEETNGNCWGRQNMTNTTCPNEMNRSWC